MHIKLKGVTLSQVPSIVIILVVLGFTISLSASLMQQLQTSALANYGNVSGAYNVTNDTMKGILQLSSWTPTIALAIAFAVILGIIGLFLSSRNGGGL